MRSEQTGAGVPRLLIVDDHALTREGLLSLFLAADFAETTATRPAEAARVARPFAPQVVLLAVGLSCRRELQVATAILAKRPTARVLFLDEAVRPVNVCAALTMAARGYWTKQASFEQIAKAVRRVATGETSFCSEVQQYLVSTTHGLRFHPPGDAVPSMKLSRRESEVFVLLTEGLTVRECAEQLQLAASTVDNHKSRLMKKLGVHKTVDLVRLAVGGEGMQKAEGRMQNAEVKKTKGQAQQ